MDQARSVTATFELDLPSFTVNTASDEDDGACTVAHCTLREAIAASNDATGIDTISFDIPGTGPHTIAPMSALPTITDPAVVDGTTQPGFEDCPSGVMIEISGADAGTAPGLNVTGGNTTIRGLAINGFAATTNQPGIRLATLWRQPRRMQYGRNRCHGHGRHSERLGHPGHDLRREPDRHAWRG